MNSKFDQLFATQLDINKTSTLFDNLLGSERNILKLFGLYVKTGFQSQSLISIIKQYQ